MKLKKELCQGGLKGLYNYHDDDAEAICDQGGYVAELSTHQTASWNIKIPLKLSPMCSVLISVEYKTTAWLLYTSSLSSKSAGGYLNITSTWLKYYLGKCSACPVPPLITWAKSHEAYKSLLWIWKSV
jgi:hypothetical protein